MNTLSTHWFAALLVLPLAVGCTSGSGTSPAGITVAVTPASASTTTGGTLTFQATVTGADPGQSTAVTWSVSESGGGTIGATTGIYVAPSTAGRYTVVATSVADASKSGSVPVVVTLGSQATDLDRLQALAHKRLYFQHASVGGESVGVYDAAGFTPPWGLMKIVADNPGSGFSVSQNANTAADIQVGQLGEWTHGAFNGDPAQKLTLFAQHIRGGLGGVVNVAIFKMGTPDIDQTDGTIAGTAQVSQTTWFNTVYKPTMDALEAEYPGTKFIHATIPLHNAAGYWGNDRYESWNNLLRAQYPGRLFDLAYWESVSAAGTRAYSADGAPCIHADWEIPNDAHVNQAGANWLGKHLLEFLVTVP